MSVSGGSVNTKKSGGHIWILAGLASGLVFGLIANAASKSFPDAVSLAQSIAEPIGRLFLRIMMMMVVPLVVSSLFLAVVEVGDVRKLGRLGLVTLFYTAILSISAVLIGVTLVNVARPGQSVSDETLESLEKEYGAKAAENAAKADKAKSLGVTLVDMLPENPLQEMVGALDGSSPGNGMLAVMFFSLLCGIAATNNQESTAGLVSTMKGLSDVCMTVLTWALKMAPLGAGCLVFVAASKLGINYIELLGVFVMVVVGGLLIHAILVYSIVLRVLGRCSPMQFYRSISDAILVAFSTSSSNATLSTSLKVAHEELELKPENANFVLTVGATGNQNGTALFEGVVVLFLAQVFKVDLSIPQQITVVLMSILAGVGTAGVPGGSIPLIIVVLKSVGVPADGIAIILGVDRLLDMSRTTVNVVGDLVVAKCVDATMTRKS